LSEHSLIHSKNHINFKVYIFLLTGSLFRNIIVFQVTDQLILYPQGKYIIVWFVISCGRLKELYDRPVDIEPTE
jgi:hypothetical protein